MSYRTGSSGRDSGWSSGHSYSCYSTGNSSRDSSGSSSSRISVVDYCLSSEGRCRYGSTPYCLASMERDAYSSGSSTDRTRSVYDNAVRGEGGSNRNHQGTGYGIQSANTSCGRQNCGTCSNAEASRISSASLQSLSESIAKLAVSTPSFTKTVKPLVQSIQALKQEQLAFKAESQRFHDLLTNNGDRIMTALRERAEARKQQAATPMASTPSKLDCSVMGHLNAGAAAVYDKSLQNTTLQQFAINTITKPVLDAGMNEAGQNLDAFVVGVGQHALKCYQERHGITSVAVIKLKPPKLP